MSYNLLSDCFICDLQLLVVLTASERHILARGGEMYNIGAQTDVFFSKYKVYFLVFYWYIVGFDIDI